MKNSVIMASFVHHATRVSDSWELSFPENWGAPESMVLNDLISWTDHPDSGVHYFSGTATYSNHIRIDDLPGEHEEWILDLGEVYDVAEILVNGKSAGILWTYPYQANITDFMQAGDNSLEIKVTNLWINRLAGDIHLPDDEKFTQTNRPPFVGPERVEPIRFEHPGYWARFKYTKM